MNIAKTKKELGELLSRKRQKDSTAGFVPTMGALHEGHISLIEASKKENDLTVVSIFVNPTQFDDPTDLNKYPKPIKEDIEKVKKAGVNILFHPSAEEIYPDKALAEKEKQQLDFGELEQALEGKHRPGHFKGVAQVVKKLLEVVKPDKLYLGQKDYQQCLILKKLIERMGYITEVKICPIVREPGGLAMSSRNIRLSPEERNAAAALSKALFYAKKAARSASVAKVKEQALKILNENPLIKVEYFEIADAEDLRPIKSRDEANEAIACVAAKVGDVRLIDNEFLPSRQQ